MNFNLIETINYHINNKLLLNIEREIYSLERITGFPIKLSKDFLLMTNVYDFHDEGYALIKTDDITDAYSKESDAFYERVCILNGLQKKIDNCPININSITDIKGVFLELIHLQEYITIHCENEDDECNFFLGKILEISDSGVLFSSLGCDGKWNDKNDYIPFEKITMIVFGDYYSKMFYQYTVH